jgi:hypothetical protein
MAVRRPNIHFSSAIAAGNNRSFNWFVIGEKENLERSPAENASPLDVMLPNPVPIEPKPVTPQYF